MTFNEFMEDGVSLKKKLESLFLVDCRENKLRLKSVDVVQPEKTYPECLIERIPYNYTVNIVCEFYEGPDAGREFPASFVVPKMCDKGFLMRSSNGSMKWRAAINLGTINKMIDVRTPSYESAYILINSVAKIYISPYPGSDGKYHIPKIILFNYRTDNGKLIVYDLYEYLIKSGIPESDVSRFIHKVSDESTHPDDMDVIKDYSPIKIENTSRYHNLADRINDKLLQLTGVDNLCNADNPYITATAIFELLKCYKRSPRSFEIFSPFDVKFNSFQDILFGEELKNKNFQRDISTGLYRGDPSKWKISGNSISGKINSIFSMHDTKFNIIQSASTSNAVAFLSQTNKIYFENYDNNKLNLKYTKDFYGLICPSKTPESVGLCNVKNELANDVVLGMDGPEIKLLDKSGETVKVTYSKYYRSRILSIDNYDYYEKKVRPSKDGTVKIFQSGKFIEVPYTGDDVWDYMREMPESGLAINTGLIPMASRCDGVRLSMGTNMLEQAIPIKGSRPPIVGTPVYKDVYQKSDLNYKSEVDGVVEGVIDNFIRIRLDNGSSKVITTPPAFQSNAHTFNRFSPAVKVGDRVTKGTVLMESDSFKDKSLSLTTPLKVAYMMYGAKTDEDAIIISETASRQLAHSVENVVRIDIPYGLDMIFDKNRLMSMVEGHKDMSVKDPVRILQGLNEFGLPDVGKTLYKGQKLYAFIQEHDPNSLMGRLLKLTNRRSDANEVGEKNYDANIGNIPYGLQECIVKSVKVYGRPSSFHNTEFLKIYNYYKTINDNKRDELRKVLGNVEIPEYNITLVDGARSKSPAVSIVITTESMNYAKKGDKIANRFGSKGTISEVLPDMECPRIGGPNGERIDIIMPAQSTLNRKNMAQLMEVNLCEVSRIAFKNNSEHIINQEYEKIRESLNMLYQTKRFSGYTDEELVKYHNKYNNYYDISVGSMDKKYTPEVLNKISKYFNYRTEGYYVYIPKFDTMTKNTVLTGTTEIMRLHFVPEWKAKSTANTEFNNDLVLGIGSGKAGGQKIGQMEAWQLMAYNTMDEFYHLSNKDGDQDRSYDRTLGEIVTSMKLIGLNVTGYEDKI